MRILIDLEDGNAMDVTKNGDSNRFLVHGRPTLVEFSIKSVRFIAGVWWVVTREMRASRWCLFRWKRCPVIGVMVVHSRRFWVVDVMSTIFFFCLLNHLKEKYKNAEFFNFCFRVYGKFA